MPTKLMTALRKIWKDILAAVVLVVLIILSIKFKYNLGMLVGFLILFIFLTFDRIRRIIFDMNVRKIFGIEFGEFEKEQVKQKVREEMGRKGSHCVRLYRRIFPMENRDNTKDRNKENGAVPAV